MSDDLIAPNGQQGKPHAVLIIALMPDGSLNVNHPQNEVLARFMLDKARATLDDVFRPRPRVDLIGGETLRHLKG